MTNLQAIRASIKHWIMDIKRPLKTDEIYDNCGELWWTEAGTIVKCNEGFCALCKLNHSRCVFCALVKWVGWCGDKDSLYNRFYDAPCTETAESMIQGLVLAYKMENGKSYTKAETEKETEKKTKAGGVPSN